MARRKFDAVLFDLDGTFADTAPDLGAALNRLLAEEGRQALDMGVFRPHTSAGTRGMLGIGFGIAPEESGYASLAERFLAHYTAALCVDTVLFEGMAELVAELENLGLAWGIVTNKPARFTLPLMAALGYGERAACIVSGDSTPNPKPHPDPIFLGCLDAGTVPARCLYVGDDLRDIQAGQAAGTGTVAAAWGYLGTGVPIGEWGADSLVSHPLEILKLV
ncbi:MAG: HAD-IA family hydrolase [Rhodocyclaceae bacterium]|nr:HAD-IA family hydrolase [Rhodocyclaceae bacterium]